MISTTGVKYKVRNHWNIKLDKYTNEGVARGKKKGKTKKQTKKKLINKADPFFDPVNFTATQVLGWYKGMSGERAWA